MPILGRLARDRRAYVWRAAATALRNLARKAPNLVLPELSRWRSQWPETSSAVDRVLAALSVGDVADGAGP